MADKIKFSQLPAASDVKLTDICAITQSGVSKKATFQLVKDAVGGETFANAVIVWADPAGSNVTGDGTFDNPFQTIMYAQDAIDDASSSKIYIICWTGTIGTTIATPKVKPWIIWLALNSLGSMGLIPVILSTAIVLDDDFEGQASPALCGWIGFYLFAGSGTCLDLDNSDFTVAAANIIAQNCNIAGTFSNITSDIGVGQLNLRSSNGSYFDSNLTLTKSQVNAIDTYFGNLVLIDSDSNLAGERVTFGNLTMTDTMGNLVNSVLKNPATLVNSQLTVDMQTYRYCTLRNGANLFISDLDNTLRTGLSNQGYQFYSNVRGATLSNLNATYNNGSSGVGATLTNAGSLAEFELAGLAFAVGDLVLVAGQSNKAHNGLYNVTILGSGAVAWELTRNEEMDTAGAVTRNKLLLSLFGSFANVVFYVADTCAVMGTNDIDIPILNVFDIFENNAEEVIESNIPIGSAISISNATQKTLTSITLTTGTWRIWADVGFLPDTTTLPTIFEGGISTTDDTLPIAPNGGAFFRSAHAFPAGEAQVFPVGEKIVKPTTTTTYYLVLYSAFTISTMTMYGYVGAQRESYNT
jgi:hypothetical protein